jgi:putative membrane protein
VAGVSVDSWQSIVAAAFVLGLFNAFLRPVIIVLTLPFTILTLGFFTLIINALMFYLAAKFVKGFNVMNFWSAFWAALTFSIISTLLNILLSPGLRSLRMGSYRQNRPNASRYEGVIDVEGEVVDDEDGKNEGKKDD